MQFGVQGLADREDAILHALVVTVGDREGDEFRSNGTELDRLSGQALRRLPHRGVLQVAAGDRADDARHDAGFEIVVQDMAGRERQSALARRRRLRVAIESAHVARRVVGPALTADIGIEMGVAVGDDVEARNLLLVRVGGQLFQRRQVGKIFWMGLLDLRHEQGPELIRHVKARRPFQRVDQHLVFCRLERAHHRWRQARIVADVMDRLLSHRNVGVGYPFGEYMAIKW